MTKKTHNIKNLNQQNMLAFFTKKKHAHKIED
jgi:hypothetical protein